MPSAQTVVLNCAGIGSRLGLGRTKVLMELDGRTLLERHLENFRNVPDLRIVVGFQSADVIAAARAIRTDVIFVYNHDYFYTSAAYSFWLAAKIGGDFIQQWDGDLIIHPEDAEKCLAMTEPFAAYSDKNSEDGVLCSVDENGFVTKFSRENGQWEWTGPCCLPQSAISNTEDPFIYMLLEKILPIQGIYVRAMDIDTLNDYNVAKKRIMEW